MKQCRRIVNWTLKNNLQWNLNQYLTIFIQHYDFEKDVCNMVAICLGLNVMIIRRNLKSRKSEISERLVDQEKTIFNMVSIEDRF